MPDEPLCTIHVGVGGRGAWPLGLMAGDGRFRPVALVDIRADTLEAARRTAGLPPEACHAELGEALRRHPAAEAVVVITPSALHAPLLAQALHAGRHVLVEKPFTNDLADAERLVALGERLGRRLVVAQNYRFRPVERTVRRLLAEGRYGDPAYVTLIHHRHRPEVRAFTMAQPMLYEMSVPHFDSLLAMLQRPPRAVAATSFNPPWSRYPGPAAVQALIEFAGGVQVTYLGTFTSHSDSWETRIECAGGALHWTAHGPLRALLPGGETAEVPLDHVGLTPEAQILDAFWRYVREGEEPEISGRRNLDTLRLVCACIDASSQDRKIRFA